MVVAPFVTAVWWTKNWLMDPIIAKWRYVVSTLAGALLWVYLAFASTNVLEASGGVSFQYGSMALAYFCAFMAFVSVVGGILGLVLWAEEEGEQTARDLPAAVRTRFGD